MIFNNPVLLGLAGMLVLGKTESPTRPEPIAISQEKFFGVDPSTCEVIEFMEDGLKQGNISEILSEGTPVRITAQRRLSGGQYESENAASLFDTSYPVAETSDFETPNPNALRAMGKVLTVNGSEAGAPTLNKSGGKLELDFSAMNSITLKAVHVLDITKSDAGSKLELINKNGEIIRTFPLPITNTHGAVRLNTGDVKGVAKMRVVFGDEKHSTGGGAIDVIEFCRD
ncbi:hypothetical protein [Pontibacter beigongshangensis]|uniref:hypothetical protein n=1 Tax=Pontibacter beigongshangensis TaxID=2574733 RepID=UPI00164F1C54|nr:hypothetical protein [Pontibacter beigongshangensis]